MSWRFRREGSTQESGDLSYDQLVAGLYEAKIETTDEVRGPADASWQAFENHPEFAEIAADVEPPLSFVHDEPTTLDMNPLIDVCLVLLVFFILTTSYAVAVLKVIPLEGRNKTDAGIRILTKEDVKKRIQVEATKTATGPLQIRIENQAQDVLDAKGKLDPAKLTAALRQYTHGADRRTDMLLDARGLDWGTVVALQDAAKAAEIRTIDHVLPKESK
jgi:biopolymer transport protein ExbD